MPPRHRPTFEVDPTTLAWQALNEDQQAFVTHYVTHQNAQRASRAIGKQEAYGYSALRSPRVRAVLAEAASQGLTDLGLSVGTVAAPLLTILQADPRDLLGEDGAPLCLADLPDSLALAVREVEVDSDGRIRKLKLEPRIGAAKLIGSYLKMYNPTVDVNVAVTLEALVLAAVDEGGASFSGGRVIDGGAPPREISANSPEHLTQSVTPSPLENSAAPVPAAPGFVDAVAASQQVVEVKPPREDLAQSVGTAAEADEFEEEAVPEAGFDPNDYGGEWDDEEEDFG